MLFLLAYFAKLLSIIVDGFKIGVKISDFSRFLASLLHFYGFSGPNYHNGPKVS